MYNVTQTIGSKDFYFRDEVIRYAQAQKVGVDVLRGTVSADSSPWPRVTEKLKSYFHFIVTRTLFSQERTKESSRKI